MEKPFYTQFEKLRNEIKDKDKIIQQQSEEILTKENAINELQEKIGKALKFIEDNGLSSTSQSF